jgi:hypothetical protein
VVFLSGDIPVYFWMVQYWNIVLLTVRFLDVAILLLISYKLSFPIVDLKMSFLPTLASKSSNRIVTVFRRIP